MRSFRWAAIGIAAAAVLAACGGSDDNKVNFTQTVSFGDSLSDVGTYKVGTVAALGGGKFTINGTGDKVWTEDLAAAVGTPAQCAARTGLLPNDPQVTGAPVQDFPNCYNYAEGSSRVTAEGSGPNGVALQTSFGEVNIGLLANSLHEQFTRHLAKVGSYSGTELVTVNAGGNDLFMQLTALGAAAGGGQAAAATAGVAGWSPAVITTVTGGGQAAVDAAAVAGWSPAVITTVTGGGQAAVDAAGTAAVAAMAQAGTELVADVKALVLGKGARYVLVRNLGDVNQTPFGRTLDPATQGLITAMTNAFNSALSTGLAGSVVLLDDYARTQAAAANPSAFGFSNVTTKACGPNAFGGSSLVCNSTNLIAGDTSKYAFADDVHPTPYAHQGTADAALALLMQAGWR
jgi:phospholipase/lecithinase/hemolysin